MSVWIDLMACGGDMGDSASDLTSRASHVTGWACHDRPSVSIRMKARLSRDWVQSSKYGAANF